MYCVIVLQRNQQKNKDIKPWLYYQCPGVYDTETEADSAASTAASAFAIKDSPASPYKVVIGEIKVEVFLTSPPIEKRSFKG